MEKLESLLLRIANKRGNKQTREINGSDNLRPELNKLIKDDVDGRQCWVGDLPIACSCSQFSGG